MHKEWRTEVRMPEDDLIVVARDLPQIVVLDRKFGIRKFTPEDLDRICKEQYGETYARYDAEKDCCIVTFERVKSKPLDVDLFRVGCY